jgi:drug/metabolite transporter (DMT)-like permease
MPSLSPERLRLGLAFFLIYFIWGSTYLAIRYAIETIPPFLMAGTRFFCAGLLLFLIMRLRGAAFPDARQWGQLWITGTFLFLGGNGLVVWAEQYIDSGLAALLVSTLPLWLILLDWLWAGGTKPGRVALIGVGLGMLGTAVLMDPVRIGEDSVDFTAAMMVILASLFWAFGSIHSKRFRQPPSIFISAACQMLGGGLSLLVLGFLLGEHQGFTLSQVSMVSAAGFFYLMIFGSMIAISAYVWLLQNASATSISSYAFVNPVVAILLGWLVADEMLNGRILLGAIVILSGVLLVLRVEPRGGK